MPPIHIEQIETPRRFGSIRRFTARTGVGLALAIAVGFFLVWLGFLAWLAVKAVLWLVQLLP